jgi:hypothetical protein
VTYIVPNRSYVFKNFPTVDKEKGAVLIWHTKGDGLLNGSDFTYWYSKDIDIEAAHGKTNWIDDQYDTGVQNPISGRDKLEVRKVVNDQIVGGPYYGQVEVGESNIFYLPGDGKRFAFYSNPNSNWYNQNENYFQNISSGFIFKNFQYSAGIAKADFQINNSVIDINTTLPVGNWYFSQDLVVNGGVTLTIQGGTLLNFASDKKLIVNGTLNAVGNSTNRITFTRIGTSGTWGGVVVNSGAYAYISYCDINYASTGVSINNNSNRSMVTDGQINNSDYYGISIYNSQPTLQRNKIINSPSGGAFGIFCNYYGYPFVKDNLIKGYGTSGVYCVDHSGVYWLNSTANNVIKTNQNGLYLNNYSNAYLGNNPYNGQNSIYSNTGYDVKAISNSIAYVQNTWWGVYPPNASKFYNDGNSTIDRTNPLAYDPNNSLNLYVSNEPGNNNLYSPALNILSSENDDKKEIEEQLDLFKKNGSNKDGMEALQKIERIFTQYARKDFSEFSKKELRPLIKEKDRLYPLLLELEMHQLLINGNLKEAFVINDQLEKEVNDKTANKLALFRKGFIYLLENDRAAAEKAFVEFISKYPEDELTTIVNYALGDKNSLNKADISNQEEKTAPEGFVLEDCYPNPFNPSTTIRYQIPQDGHISLKVYDMLGREVAQLVNEVKRAGEYTVSFDGSKLSSGVYIYKLVGNNVNISKKMILMK